MTLSDLLLMWVLGDEAEFEQEMHVVTHQTPAAHTLPNPNPGRTPRTTTQEVGRVVAPALLLGSA